MRSLIFLAFLACAPIETETETDTAFVEPEPAGPCDVGFIGTALADCEAGCAAAEAIPGPTNLGRLACISGDACPTAETMRLPDQGQGPDYQVGYDGCFFRGVRLAYEAEGCET